MTELNISKKNIEKLFSEMQGKKFIIPDYQRNYSWDSEKCEILWDDIVSHYEDPEMKEEDYFLGTIVTCKNDNDRDIDLIDGQQRITSLLLLFRAFYYKLELERQKEDANISGLKRQIEPCMWDVDPISQKPKEPKVLRIKSLVATEQNNKIFHDILKTGESPDKSNDLYSENYKFFQSKSDTYAKDHPTRWQNLIVKILYHCIVLPVECSNTDIALNIFSTLNDRGLPLSDSDIFKSQIYGNQNTDQKKDFIEQWQSLQDTCEQADIRPDLLFRYYSHVLRAKRKEKKKEKNLRSFYADEKYKELREDGLITDLIGIGKLWVAIREMLNGDSDLIIREILNGDSDLIPKIECTKFLHCLSHYPNDYWKYITTVFYYVNKDEKGRMDSNSFLNFLKKLTAFLFYKFIEQPSVNYIKDDIYKAYIVIADSKDPVFTLNEDFVKTDISKARHKCAKGLILLDAYLHADQDDLLPHNFQIEHILPKKWQNTNYDGWERKDANEFLEKFGNKVAIEKKINIQAGNRYFGLKKLEYQGTKIARVKELAEYNNDNWSKDDIEKREVRFIDTIYGFLHSI